MLAKFTLKDQVSLLDPVIDGLALPAGVTIRPVMFDGDIDRVSDLILDFGVDTINPAYGMAPETTPGEICLVAERGGRLAGQISCSVEALGKSQTNIDLWVTGIFVSSHLRREGIGLALGQAALGLCEAWRRQLATELGRNAYGSINISGDTEPGTAGEAIISRLEDLCLELEEEVFESTADDDASQEP